MKRLPFVIAFAMLLSACGNGIHIKNLTVEHQDGSQALATNQPRFSWQYETKKEKVEQIEYRIVVSTTAQNASKGIGDLWDSGVQESSRMLYIPYEGKELHSRDIAYWKVYTIVAYGDNGKKTAVESDVRSFEISLLNPDDWHAHWIGRDYDDDSLNGHTAIAARYLRKEFRLKKDIIKARLYISGLGVYSAYINNMEVAPTEWLKPTLSDYTRRIYFNAYDVTELVREDGLNAVGVTLEGGRFTTVRHDSNYLEWCGINHAAHYGLPQLLMQLEVTYRDGTADTIISGKGWKITNRGPIRKSNEFDGETYDARLDLGDWTKPDYDDSQWDAAIVDYDRQNMYREDIYNPRHRVAREYPVVTGSPLPNKYQRPDPMQLLTPQPNPNIKVQEQLKPVSLFQKGDKWILDMGQNMVGVLDLDLFDTQSRDTIILRYAETLASDSTLYTANLRSAECTDRFIARGGRYCWHPMFTYHGFRYVEISGLRYTPKLNNFTGLVLYDEMPFTGTFETSNEIINAVYRNATWGIRGNYRSMPTDCPQRDERMQLWREFNLRQPPPLCQVAARPRRQPVRERSTPRCRPSLLAQLHRQHDLAGCIHHRGRHDMEAFWRLPSRRTALRRHETLAATHEEILPQGRHPHPRHLRRLVRAARKPRTHPFARHQPHHMARLPFDTILCRVLQNNGRVCHKSSSG